MFRFKGYYASYFAALGLFLPYWPLYLQQQGLQLNEIGILLALGYLVKILAPPLFGHWADHGSRTLVLRTTALLTAIIFPCYLWPDNFWRFFFVTLIFNIPHAAPLALVEATTLDMLKKSQGDYGRIRLWGSLGFIVAALGMGPILDYFGLFFLPLAMSLLYAINAGFAFWLPASDPHLPTSCERQIKLIDRQPLIWFYLASVLMQFSHSAYYGFFSIYMENLGYSKMLLGWLWALGVIAEIVLLAHSLPIIKRFGPGLLLIFALMMAVVRWGLYGCTTFLPLLILGQLLHAFTFGLFHVAAMQRLIELTRPNERARAQSWYGSLCYGLGLGVGALFSGQSFNLLGPAMLFLTMGAIALMGVASALHAHRLYHCSKEAP